MVETITRYMRRDADIENPLPHKFDIYTQIRSYKKCCLQNKIIIKTMYTWAKELPCGVTVCDRDANILFINDKAAKTFARFGDNLTGHNLREFHGDRQWKMIREMIDTGSNNSYTIEKAGVKKLIYQTPWFDEGKIGGLVELSIELPLQMPHYVRD